MVEIDDVVATVEGAEERNLEPADIPVADKIGLAFNPLPALFRTVVALVYHPYTAIVTQPVFRGHLLQTAFKRMVEPGNFIPCSQVAIDIKAGNRRNAIRNTGALGISLQLNYQVALPYQLASL